MLGLCAISYSHSQKSNLLIPYSTACEAWEENSVRNESNLKNVTEEISTDSIVAITYSKNGYYLSKSVTTFPELFNNHKTTCITSYEWDAITDSWQPNTYSTQRIITANDENGRILQEIYIWDESSLKWKINDSFASLNYRIKNEYNNRKQLISSERTLFNKGVADWMLDSKITYLYDSIGQKIEAAIYDWGDYDGDGIPEWNHYQNQYFDYTRNNAGQLIQSSVSYMDLDYQIIRETRSDFTLDSIGNIIEKTNWQFLPNDSVWNGTAKYAYSYNYNKITSETTYSWNYSTNDWMPVIKNETEFDANQTKPAKQISYRWNMDSLSWEGNSASELIYNQAGVLSGNINYFWVSGYNIWERQTKSLSTFNSVGETTMTKYYEWMGQEWELGTYTVYYPITDDESQKIEAEETKPVDNNNGKFELTLTLPTEATITGSFNIDFPNGIALDKDNTELASELADQFELVFTSLNNNSWKIEIVKKQAHLKNALSEVAYKKIINVAYTVDDDIKAGDKTIEVKNLSFEKSTGGTIQQESIAVNVNIKNSLGINDAERNKLTAYVYGNELVLKSSEIESGVIYSTSGVIISKFEKNSQDDLIINISNLPSGVYIIKSELGNTLKISKK